MRGTGEKKRKPGWRKVKARVVRPFDRSTGSRLTTNGGLFSVSFTVGNHKTRYPR